MKKHFLIGLITSLLMLALALTTVNNAQAAPPNFQAAGGTNASTGNCTAAWPTHVLNDIALLFVESLSEDVVSAPAGFAAVLNSPQNTLAQTTTGTRLTVFWARASSASMPNVTITDPGNHCIAQILTYRGVVATGDPWDVTAGDKDDTSSTSVSATGVTTSVADTLIVVAVAQGRDANSTTTFSGWTNGNLTGITERADFARHNGNGGGFGVMDGVKAAAGATGNTTATLSKAFRKAFLTIALKPPPPAGVSNKIAFVPLRPNDATAGVAISPNVTVDIQDSGGTRVNDNTTQVTISIGSNPGGGALTVDSFTVTAVAGVATFTNLKIDKGGTGYTLSATALSLPNPNATSDPFNIRGPSKLAFSVQPSNTTISTAISPAVEVQIRDSLDNLVPIATNTVTIEIDYNPGTPVPGTLTGGGAVPAVAGVATFDNLSIDRVGYGYTLKATAAGLSPDPISIGFDITPVPGTYPITQCMSDRYGGNLNSGGDCNAQDVKITRMSLSSTTPMTSCIGGETVIVDLDVVLQFGSAEREDVGIFIVNDGKNIRLTSANGGAATCRVEVLPTTAPFTNLEPAYPADTCGDGSKASVCDTPCVTQGEGTLKPLGVPVLCQATADSGGKLFVPFGTSWNTQKGTTPHCTSPANPSIDKAKCKIPETALSTIEVVVLPSITKTDNKTTLSPGESTTYTVVITNTTGVTLTNAVFTDTANPSDSLTFGSVTCTPAGGAICPSPLDVAGMTIPSMPNASSLTFTIAATVKDPSYATFTNTASVTVADPAAAPVADRTVSASDSTGGSGSGSGGSRIKIIKWREVFK